MEYEVVVDEKKYKIEVEKMDEAQKMDFDSGTVDVVYEMIKDGYEYQQKRWNQLDSKIGISLPLISALLLSISSQCRLKELMSIEILTVSESIVPFFLIILYLASLAFSLTSAVFLFLVIKPRDHRILNLQTYYDDKILKRKKETIKIMGIQEMLACIKMNDKINEKRYRMYRKGNMIAGFSIGIFVIYEIVLNCTQII